MIISKNFKSVLDQIESNLKEVLHDSERLRDHCNREYDPGNLADKSLLFVLSQNVENNRKALINFLSLPLI